MFLGSRKLAHCMSSLGCGFTQVTNQCQAISNASVYKSVVVDHLLAI